MKIIHVYSRNLDIFEEAIKGTGCCLNGSSNFQYMHKSFTNFNARDVLGLIVFQQHITTRTLKILKAFDEYFVFSPRPIVVICDEAQELYNAKKIRVRNSPLFLIDSVDGTISDIDIHRIFTTLVCEAGDMYALKDVEQAHRLTKSAIHDASVLGDSGLLHSDIASSTLSNVDEILSIFKKLGV